MLFLQDPKNRPNIYFTIDTKQSRISDYDREPLFVGFAVILTHQLESGVNFIMFAININVLNLYIVLLAENKKYNDNEKVTVMSIERFIH